MLVLNDYHIHIYYIRGLQQGVCCGTAGGPPIIFCSKKLK